nr:TetR/AcrR family transcriptional regulator [Allopusillimonas ginsengisoli]
MTERGFHATGIEEVLARVKVPKGSFYHYFESKQAFGQVVIDNYAEYFAKKLDQLFSNTSHSPVERLKAFVADATRAMERYEFQRGCLIGNMGQELGGLNDAFRQKLEAVLQSWQVRVAAVLNEAKIVGELAEDADTKAIAEFFWIGWEGAILRSKLTRSVVPLDRFAHMFFTHIVVPGYRK